MWNLLESFDVATSGTVGKIIRGNFNTTIKLRNKTTAIIAAGGKGTRMGLDFNKILLK